ncbi:proline racemase [Colletotrichum higginsianum]|nr:proline racemase [Colletotrichum higginsianum]
MGSEIRTVEMHTSGEPARIVYAGYPEIPGTLLEQRSLARSRLDHVRRSIVYEPRGHRDMYAAVLRPHTELVDEGRAHMGALFLTHEGYGVMCGHATIALGRFLVDCDDETVFPRRRDLEFDEERKQVEVRLHAPVGLVRVTVPTVMVDGVWRTDTSRLITFLSVPTLATAIDLSVSIPPSMRWAELGGGGAQVTVDVGFGGAFYAVVRASALGFPASLAKPDVERLSNAAKRLKQAFNASPDLRARLRNPDDGDPQYVYGVMVTDAGSGDEAPAVPGSGGAETGLYFFGDQQIDRSPTGSVVQARVALAPGLEGCRGYRSAFVGTPVDEVEVNGSKAWRVEVSGRAFYVGSSTFVAEEEDDVGRGFSFQSLGLGS